MAIEAYSFGRIRIDGREYESDVIVYPERVDDTWWRQQGHQLDVPDLAGVMAASPQILVIGTGYLGRMRVSPEALEALRARGIETRVSPTKRAVAEFNRLQREAARVVAALHLTC